MRKLLSTAAAAAALMAAAFVSVPANAIVLGTPAGLKAAIDDVAVTDQAHCRPYLLHHRWRWGHPTWDGCFRRRGALFWSVPIYRRHHFFHRQHFFHSQVHLGPRFVGGQRFHFSSGARFSGARIGGARMGGARMGGARMGGGRHGH